MAHSKPDSPSRPSDQTGDRWLFYAFFAALLTIVFVSGALVTAAGITPGRQIARAYDAGQAYYRKVTASKNVYRDSDLWRPSTTRQKGVTVLDGERVQPGLTLYTSGEATSAYLVDLQGRILHRWHRPFSEIWSKESSPVTKPQPDDHVYFRAAKLFPNGDLLVVIEGNGDTPYGYALAKLDKDSNLLWSRPLRAHHDLGVADDGRIYVLTHDIVDAPLENFDSLAEARIEDYLVVLTPQGEEISRLALTELVARSPYAQLLHTVPSYAAADPLHTNAVQPVSAAAAAGTGIADAGDVLVSFRELNAIGIVDPERRQLTWATRGPWLGQHYPVLLDNGNILLFDNRGNFDLPGGGSRILEFDPASMEIVWQYRGTETRPFFSAIRGDQQRLANGNTLITESDAGRIVEVTRSGERVWEYFNPARKDSDGERIAIVNHAQRLAESQVRWLSRDTGALARSPN